MRSATTPELLRSEVPKPAPSAGDPDGFPLVGFAATVQFAPGDDGGYAHVESRMLLAGEAGAGTIEVNGEPVRIRPSTIVVLPWGHAVTYRPDRRDPYLVYGAHLIPWHAACAPVDLAVPHHRDHPLAGVATRQDRDLTIGPGLWLGDGETHPVLRSMIILAARVWDRGTPTFETARSLGTLLVDELRSVGTMTSSEDRVLPVRLRRMLTWVHAEPGRSITLAQLAAVADASPATVNRLFRAHLGISPLSWVLQTRIEVAEALLVTTTLTVEQVAHRAGFGDAYYFSRQFRSRTGVTPSVWRRERSAR